MKKYILSFSIFISLFHFIDVNAQEEGSIWINAVTGLNSNWIIFQNMYGNPEIEYSTTFGFSGGMGMTYFISNDWGFSGTILASKLGQNYSGMQKGAEAERKVKLTYIEVPFQFMRNIPNTQDPTWISVGPDIMFLVKAEQEYRRQKGGEVLPFEEHLTNGDIRKRYNPFDVGINIAINKMYELNASDNAMFLFSINSTIGLTDINDVEWKIPEYDGSYEGSHNFYIGVKIGLMFNASRNK